jgi:hypothetical protein
MRTLFRLAGALALTLAGAALAAPLPDTMESTEGFRSFDLPAAQTGSFELSFEATPLAGKIDCFTGIAESTPRRANDVAVLVRFNDSGAIDVRNGSSFAADQKLGYEAGRSYRVRIAVDMAKKIYSVFVAPAGGAEVALAKDYAFRSGQGSVQSLGKLVLAGYKGADGFAGGHRVSGVAVKTQSAR